MQLLVVFLFAEIINLANNYVNIQRNEYSAQIRFCSNQGHLIKELSLFDLYSYKVAPEGKYLYLLTNDGINIYNCYGEQVGIIDEKGMLAVAPNDKYLACASENSVRLYQASKKIFEVNVVSSAIRQIIFSADNNYLGVMMRNHFTLIDLSSYQILWTKNFPDGQIVFSKFDNNKIILIIEHRPLLNFNIFIYSLTGNLKYQQGFYYQQFDEQIQDIEVLSCGIKAKTHLREWIIVNQAFDIERNNTLFNNYQNLNFQLGPETIPWPLAPTDSLHPIGNNWFEFQNYGSSSYFHPGIDILSPELPGVPVYAVKSGYVKAWLSTGGTIYWRLAIADSSLSYTDSCNGYLYAHIDSARYHKNVGDFVTIGELIGYLVYWPVDSIHFHHLHFAKIRDCGATWNTADWTFIYNPLILLLPNFDTIPPKFENSLTNQKFAFCRNNTSTYLSPNSLTGDVDIIAKIHDKFSVSTGDTVWDRLIPLKIEYEIIGEQCSLSKTLSFVFDGRIPSGSSLVSVVYKRDNTCYTQGDYDNRNYYFIITNNDGDSIIELSDAANCWRTTDFPNGTYWIKIYAYDTHNISKDSMPVIVNNSPGVAERTNPVIEQLKTDKINNLYNILGQKLNNANYRQLKPGIYFYRNNDKSYKVLIIRQTG